MCIRSLAILAFPACLLVTGTESLAQSLLYEHEGPSAPLQYGWRVVGLGDIDQDGYEDYGVGGWVTAYVEIISGLTGKVHRTHQKTGCFGKDITNLGDVNDDGVPDYAIGAPRSKGAVVSSGIVHVYSGADGLELYNLPGQFANSRFGLFVENAGRIDADSVDDLLIGAIWDSSQGPFRAGAAYVYSGASQNLLYSYFGSSSQELMGYGLAGIGDIDGDGADDFAISAPHMYGQVPSLPPGSVGVYSGASGSLLRTHNGTQPGERFGTSLTGLGDVDYDGVPDYAIGAPEALGGSGLVSGQVQVLSGATGGLIRTHSGEVDSALGESVRGTEDLDGDGIGDYLAGACYCRGKNGAVYPGTPFVRIWSGASGAVIGTIYGQPFEKFGYTVDGLGDLNGDGLAEFIVGAPLVSGVGFNSGSAFVYSARKLELTTDCHELSLSAGGKQVMSLDFGPGAANDTVVVLGSMSGIAPGIAFGPFSLPLNPDNMFSYSLTHIDQAPYTGSLRVLDANGQATTTFTLPPGTSPSHLGRTLHHAALKVNAIGMFDAVSNPVSQVWVP